MTTRRQIATFGLALAAAVAVGLHCPTSWAAPLAVPTERVTAQGERTADDVVREIVLAYGGRDRLIEMSKSGCRSQGRLTVTSGISGAENKFRCEIVGKGEKVRIETDVIGQKMVLGFDGTVSWTKVNDWVNESTETQARRIVEEIKHGLLLLVSLAERDSKPEVKAQVKIEYLGIESAQGRPCDVLKVYAEDGKATTFFADRASHLVLKSEYMGTDHERGVPALQAVEYFDYQSVSGNMTPYRTVEYVAGKLSSETVLDQVEYGVAVDDSVFSMPGESPITGLEDGFVEVPIEIAGNEVLVKVRVNDKLDLKFLVDTGASQTVIDRSVAETIAPLSTADFSITGGSKAVPLSYVAIESLKIGAATLPKMSALASDLSSFKAAIGTRPDGLIGANILRRFLVTIDYQGKTLRLADPKTAAPPAHAFVVKTTPTFGATALVVSATLDGKTDLSCLVDTGAAFSNLPQSAATPLYSGPILPVGQIFGIDGQALSIGSIRLKSLKVGDLTIRSPVFALTPDGAGAAAGLFTTGSMGILGNNIWNRFRLTVDYRHERLYLEPQPDWDFTQSLEARLEDTRLALVETRDLERAVGAYRELESEASEKGLKGLQAMAVLRQGECHAQRFKRSKDVGQLALAAQIFQRASSLAGESGDRRVEGRVLAELASFYLTSGSGQGDPEAVSNLLQRAISLAPNDPTPYAVLGVASLSRGKTTIARQLLDQALMLDPSDWRALWAKYELFERDGKKADLALVAAQLAHYYPDAPEVADLTRAKPTGKAAGKARK